MKLVEFANSLNAELVAIKEELESYTDECCTISFDYNSESVLASPCDVLFRDGKYILDLGAVGEVAKLKVNGASVGVRVIPPYAFDITDYIKKQRVKCTRCFLYPINSNALML